jgi:hypothetical protein
VNELTHKFVGDVPEKLESGVLYVSVEYGTALHLCCCGCGREVVTPLTPTDWKLIFDGETVSLYPSIGNWNFPCRSHYWIRNDRIDWAEDWPQWKIDAARDFDKQLKNEKYTPSQEGEPSKAPDQPPRRRSLWDRFFTW